MAAPHARALCGSAHKGADLSWGLLCLVLPPGGCDPQPGGLVSKAAVGHIEVTWGGLPGRAPSM